MSEHKQVINFTVKQDGEEAIIPAVVYDPVIFNQGYYLPIEDIHEVNEFLFAKMDPTSGLDAKGKRRMFTSVEACQARILALLDNYLEHYGDRFRAPNPEWFDKTRKRICSIEPTDSYEVLFPVGHVSGTPNYVIAAKNLFQKATMGGGHKDWPLREVHSLAHMEQDASALYIRASDTTMLKVTVEGVEIVPLGTDNILIKGRSMDDLPPLDDLLPLMDDLRSLVGSAMISRVPGSPLTEIYTTRFSENDILTPEQAQTIALTRLMFIFASSAYPLLWPIPIVTGPTGSRKSSLFEIFMLLIGNDGSKFSGDAMPSTPDRFVTYATNKDFCFLDNVDKAFEEASNELQNMICYTATGGNVSLRVLYKTNASAEFSLRKHVFMTACQMPLERDDVLRRVLHLKTKETAGEMEKGQFVRRVLENRTAMWAEIILRCQNMLRAHQQNAGKSYRLITRMKEYEQFTTICADFEGTLDETYELWDAYALTYREALTTNNSLLVSMMLWIGQDPERANGVYGTTGLHKMLKDLHEEMGTEFPHRYAVGFGKALSSNSVALKAGIGMIDRPNHKKGTREITFNPTPEMIERAVEEYRGSFGVSRVKARISRGPTVESLVKW